MVLPSIKQRPTRFNTAKLQVVRKLLLSKGGRGMSQFARADYWRLQQQLERAAGPLGPWGLQELKAFGKTVLSPSSVSRALSFEQDR